MYLFKWMILSLVAALSLAADIDRITTSKAEKSSEATSASTTIEASPTLVWVTIATAVVGVSSTSYNVIQTPYTQTFSQPYSTVTESPKSGAIGLGTIKGTVGTVRADRVITVTE